MNQRLEEFLAARQATYQLATHSGAVTAQEQAAASHTSGWSVAKVLIVKERDGYVMAVLPACCVLDLNRLKIGHGPLRLATIEEIWGLRTFADRALLNVRDITMPGGDLATAIRMRASEFRRLAEPRSGGFAVPEALLSTHATGD